MRRAIFAMTVVLSAMLLTAAEIKTEKLADDIWRVRAKRGESWPESGLNRYGILAKLPVLATSDSLDFGKVKADVKLTEKGFTIDFPLAQGERVFGLGDVSRANTQRRPGRYEIYVKNVNSYIPIPMAWTSRGWGVLLNSTWLNHFDVGAADPDKMTISAPEGEVDFYIFKGDSPRALLDAYTRLCGRPTMLPIWGYGFTFVANQWIDQFALVDETIGFRDHGIPCDVMGLEPGWMEKFYDSSTHKRWDATRFYFPFWKPNGGLTFPSAMGRVGMKLSLWLCCNYDLFRYEEQLAAGKNIMKRAGVKPVKTSTGQVPDGSDDDETWRDEHIEGAKAKPFQATRPPSSKVAGGYVGDAEPYRHPEGSRPWFEHLEQFVDQGAQAFKLDGAYQVVPWNGVTNRKWSNGMKDNEAHNLYPVVYDKQMATGYEWYTGKRAMVYSAGGYAGVQKYVATWAGDTGGGLKPLISVLNLAASGHPHQSCDMTVRNPLPTGLHFGFLSPWAQQNNWDYWDIPWVDTVVRVNTFRKYAELRYQLMPYIYSTAAEAVKTGWPIARSLSMMHPEVVAFDTCHTTYYLGDNLLVGVYADTVTLPAGTWHEWRTDGTVKGGATLPVEVTPTWGGALYVKAGAIVPMWPIRQYLDKGWNEEVICHVWPDGNSTFTLHEDDGVSVGYRKGEYAETMLTLKDGVFTVGARKGTFAGMPATRHFKVAVHDGSGKVKMIDLGAVGAEGKSVTIK